MDVLSLPLFDDEHREMASAVRRLCEERLAPLSATELEGPQSASIEYVALLGQEGLFDPAIGKALEGGAPRPDLRALCLIRMLLDRRDAEVAPEDFVSPLPVGKITFDVEVDEEARLGGEGQGLVIAQATLDVMRLPAAAACIGLATQTLHKGTVELLARGVGGGPLREQQGSQWRLADALCRVEAARAMVVQTAYKRDATSSREVRATTMARQLAQDAAEHACLTVGDLLGLAGLGAAHPWALLLAEVRALRLESEFLENARTVIAQALMASLEEEGRRR